MTALWIVLGLLAAFICIALLINVNLVLCINPEPEIYARVFFFKLDLIEYFLEGRGSEEKGQVKEPKKRVKPTLERIIYVVERFVELVRSITAEACRYVRVKVCHVKIKVAGEDAAKTAQTYGLVSGAVWSALEFLSYNMNVKRCDKNVEIYPDFTSTEFFVDIKLVLKIKPIHAIGAMMHLLPILSKGKAGKNNVK